MRTAHSGHPSTLSPPPRAPQLLRGPHRQPRRLPRPMDHLYHRRSPPLTHATMDSLNGEHPLPLAPQIGPPHHCPATVPFPHPSPVPACRNPPPPSPPNGRGRAALGSPVFVEMGHQPKWLGQPKTGRPVSTRINSTFCYFSFKLIQFIPNQIQISEFHGNLFIYK
jgi:hypothetical protein